MSQPNDTSGLRAKIQKLGSNLSNMVMPNIGAFIAWGLITALFIETGWMPNERFAQLVDPMITYLLPLLIGYTGGYVLHGQRGGVVGAIATTGAIVGTDVPMFIGAMVMGPLGGWSIKKFDETFQHRVRAGFEMLVNNFSAGIIGFILTLIAFVGVGPIVEGLTSAIGSGVEAIIQKNLLPIANILIEPAKVLFLNNALNHGIFTPLGAEQVANTGKSILFLLETNPGPGLGVLLAYMFFGTGSAKSSSPGAIIISFLGGIHEIYFPYVLMRPLMFLAVIAGGVAGTTTFQLLGAGLSGAASPGSVIAISLMAPRGGLLPVLAGVFMAALVSFLVASVILKTDRRIEEEIAEEATNAEASSDELPSADNIQHIIFACDAGMGSSAMGASLLRKKVNELGLGMDVTNSAISNLGNDPNTLIITQAELTPRAKGQAPSSTHVSVDNFLEEGPYDRLLQSMVGKDEGVAEEDEDTAVEASELPDKAVENIQYDELRAIVVTYDQKSAASVMAASMIRNEFAKAGVKLPVTVAQMDELVDDSYTLFVAKTEHSLAARDKTRLGKHLGVDDLLDEKNWQQLAKDLTF